MHEFDPVLVLLIVFLVGFACVATALFFLGAKMHWGGRTGASEVPMSGRSRSLFALTAWMLPLFVITGSLKYRVSAVFGFGFLICFLGIMISGMIDTYRFRQSRKMRPGDEEKANHRNPS